MKLSHIQKYLVLSYVFQVTVKKTSNNIFDTSTRKLESWKRPKILTYRGQWFDKSVGRGDLPEHRLQTKKQTDQSKSSNRCFIKITTYNKKYIQTVARTETS